MIAASAVHFSVGNVLSRGLDVLLKNLVSFGVIALIVTAPSLIYQLIYGAAPVTTETTTIAAGGTTATFHVSIPTGGAFIAFLIELVLRQVAVGTISYGVFQEMRGQRADLADSLRRAVSLIFVVAGIAIVSAVAISLALFLLIVPGLIVATMLWVAIPVAVMERPGVIRSLSRSAALTKGNRWQVFGVILLISIGSTASFVVEGIVGAFVSWIGGAVITAFEASVTAVGYTTLRFDKDGVGIEEIAKVFD